MILFFCLIKNNEKLIKPLKKQGKLRKSRNLNREREQYQEHPAFLFLRKKKNNGNSRECRARNKIDTYEWSLDLTGRVNVRNCVIRDDNDNAARFVDSNATSIYRVQVRRATVSFVSRAHIPSQRVLSLWWKSTTYPGRRLSTPEKGCAIISSYFPTSVGAIGDNS